MIGLTFALWLVASTIPDATSLTITGVESLKIDAESTPDAARLSDPAARTKSGFVLAGKATWLETRAIPGGLAWRPPNSSRVTVTLEGDLRTVPLRVSVRYGTDGRHWSKWIPLEEPEDAVDGKKRTWQAKIRVESHDDYSGMRTGAWYESEPRWNCDEDELCRWILQHHPKFFEKHIPVMGWLECRIETLTKKDEPAPVAKIDRIELQSIWTVGGLHSLPSDGSKADYDRKWHFIAPAPVKKKPEKKDDR